MMENGKNRKVDKIYSNYFSYFYLALLNHSTMPWQRDRQEHLTNLYVCMYVFYLSVGQINTPNHTTENAVVHNEFLNTKNIGRNRTDEQSKCEY